jgi:3-phenylpropionate/cinnamic acid dioxygenase small subunit
LTPELERLLLQAALSDFLTHEAELLDDRHFDEWLELLADDIRYCMPIPRSVSHERLGDEYTRPGQDAAWFDEGKPELALRVQQIQSGDHWAEEPLSRTTHIVANVRVAGYSDAEATVHSRFIVSWSRLETEVHLIAGKRTDLIRQDASGWKLARRQILIDQGILTTANLTTFF